MGVVSSLLLFNFLCSALLTSAGNSNATVIWIDQPSGTGFSFADSGDWGPFSEDEIADDVYAFLQGFFRQYPKYSKVGLEGDGPAGRATGRCRPSGGAHVHRS